MALKQNLNLVKVDYRIYDFKKTMWKQEKSEYGRSFVLWVGDYIETVGYKRILCKESSGKKTR